VRGLRSGGTLANAAPHLSSGERISIYSYTICPVVYHVYILCSATGVLYTGITNHLERRTLEHKESVVPGFTSDHDVNRLVYFEAFNDVRSAIAREKRIKRWRRQKKLALIRTQNPEMRDLSADSPPN
jgi:putative endonuclease